MDRLTSMAVFARIVEASSFSAAARSLGISQATASKHVQMLEEWLGARLLNRTTRRVGLTEVGKGFYAQCTQILADIDDAKSAGRQETPLRGPLRIAAPVCLGSTRLGELMHAFVSTHPDTKIEVFVSDRVVNPLEDGFDLVIRLGAGETGGGVVRPVAALPQALCASPEYLAGRAPARHPADLARHRCLLDQAFQPGGWQFTGPGGSVSPALSYVLVGNNALLLRDAALAGAGVVMTPEFVVESDLASGRLARLLPGWAPPSLDLSVVIPAGRQLSPKIQAAARFVAERLVPATAEELDAGELVAQPAT